MYKITNEAETGSILTDDLTEVRKLADLSRDQVSKLFQGRIIRNGGLVIRKLR